MGSVGAGGRVVMGARASGRAVSKVCTCKEAKPFAMHFRSRRALRCYGMTSGLEWQRPRRRACAAPVISSVAAGPWTKLLPPRSRASHSRSPGTARSRGTPRHDELPRGRLLVCGEHRYGVAQVRVLLLAIALERRAHPRLDARALGASG